MIKIGKGWKLATVALMSAILIGACSGNNGGGTTPSASAPPSGSGEAKVKLKVLASINGLTKDLNEIQYLKDIADQAGVEIEWTQIKSGWDERKNPMLATGDLPDVFIGALNDGDISTYSSLFLPLQDLIDSHAPHIKRMFDEVPATERIATSIDGNIYGLPSVLPHRPGSSVVQMINKKWLDQLGLPVPRTLDELYEVLKAFKENDPNGNGLPDEIPFDWSPDQGNNSALALLGAYGNYALNFYGLNNVKDGKFVYLPETEDYKQLIVFLHRLYADGLVNKEVITQDWSQYDSRSKDPNAAVVGYTFGWSIDQRAGEVWADDYIVFEPIAVEEGISPLWPSDPNGMKIQANKAQITSSSRNPEAAIKWLDLFYTEEASIQGYYGSFGIGTEKLDGGKYRVADAPDGFTDDTWKWTNALVDQGMLYMSEELESRFEAPASIQERLDQDALLAPYFQKPENVIPNLKLTKEEADEISIINADMDKLVSIKWAQWISMGGVEQEWDGFVKELYRMNLERYKEIHQHALDRQR